MISITEPSREAFTQLPATPAAKDSQDGREEGTEFVEEETALDEVSHMAWSIIDAADGTTMLPATNQPCS